MILKELVRNIKIQRYVEQIIDHPTCTINAGNYLNRFASAGKFRRNLFWRSQFRESYGFQKSSKAQDRAADLIKTRSVIYAGHHTCFVIRNLDVSLG